MSDIGRRDHLQRSAAQLPVSAYFDQALYQREIELLFRKGPGYIGHALMVPNTGDYFALPAEKEGRLLVRGERGLELLSNVCRHRQAVMLNGRGNTGQIVCPLHRWTYDLQGTLLGAPHFEEQPCLNLGRSPMQNWKGLLFSGGRNVAADLARMGAGSELDFSGYMLDHVEVHECAYNWKTFIEVYLEDYHVEPFHPGLGKFVECGDLSWEFGDWWSVQTVGVHRGLVKPGSVSRQDLAVEFVVTDTQRDVPVRYVGLLPDLFKEGKGVVAQGRLQAGQFVATEVLAKHDENYMPPEAQHALDAAAKARMAEGAGR